MQFGEWTDKWKKKMKTILELFRFLLKLSTFSHKLKKKEFLILFKL